MNLKSDFERDQNFVDFVVKISMDLIFSKRGFSQVSQVTKFVVFHMTKAMTNIQVYKRM